MEVGLKTRFGFWVLLLALSGLFYVQNVKASAPLTPIKLALNWKPEPQFGGFYAAQVGHWFEKHGLKAEIIPGGSGTPVVQIVGSGTLDFGIASADEVIIARSHGSDVVALFAVYQTNPQAIMSHTERHFKNIKDVFESSGTLAVQKGLPYAQYLLKKFTLKANLVPYQGGVSTFLKDPDYSQQCFATSEPLIAKKENVAAQTFLVADEGYNPYTTVLITRGDVLKKNPQLVKSLVAAVRDGWGDYLANPEPTNKAMAVLNKAMDPATFAASAEVQKPLIQTPETQKKGLGKMTSERWSELTKQLVDLKIIQQAPVTQTLFVDL
jgi:NitT/TauT family transport system substrate-binding protein